jgi:hypothetical protein
VLLDALGALADHRRAVILVGAQAIYLHTHGADIAVAEYTTDGDIALDPSLLADDPKLDALMSRAGFSATREPGTWVGPDQITIDLMVPATVAGGGAGHDWDLTGTRSPGEGEDSKGPWWTKS